MTTLAAAVRAPLTTERRHVAAVTFIVVGLINIGVFGVLAHAGDAGFELSLAAASVKIPVIRVAAAPVCYALGAVSLGLGVLRATVPLRRLAKRLAIAGVLVCFLLSLLCWADAGAIPLNVIIISQGTFTESIPLILGALAGCLCERSGVINIAIEGQLLFGAFTAAIVASAFGGLWVGLVAGSLAGGLVGVLLAVFAISFLMDQIVLGVVLNVLVLGMTDYFYDRLMSTNPNYNTGITFGSIKIPVLSEIPIIGPIFFDSTIFLYITYVAIIVIQVALFHSRWGLRVRAVGEHPTAADTVGISVLWIRYRNVILGGLVAGIGGAYLTIGSVGSFIPDISSGFGYIALAALIFGRWTPLGALAAALLFGFCEEMALVLPTVNPVLPAPIMNMAPYVATIIAVAGLVGKVRPPKADGQPYVKA
ncbi:MAG TPA: ABC transporter permease [Streptosporangiaceae bacterium]|nr:ABC transporter permease [Streptosporangiaceae bacterium]